MLFILFTCQPVVTISVVQSVQLFYNSNDSTKITSNTYEQSITINQLIFNLENLIEFVKKFFTYFRALSQKKTNLWSFIRQISILRFLWHNFSARHFSANYVCQNSTLLSQNEQLIAITNVVNQLIVVALKWWNLSWIHSQFHYASLRLISTSWVFDPPLFKLLKSSFTA